MVLAVRTNWIVVGMAQIMAKQSFVVMERNLPVWLLPPKSRVATFQASVSVVRDTAILLAVMAGSIRRVGLICTRVRTRIENEILSPRWYVREVAEDAP
jgi:hypothetical protein